MERRSIDHLLFFLLVVASFSMRWVYADAPSQVIVLTDNNFDELVMKREGPILVEFYSPYCGHCISFAPKLDKIARDLKTLIPVGKVDSTANGILTDKYEIKFVPNFLLFGSNKSKPILFRGAVGQRAISQFALSHVAQAYTVLGADRHLSVDGDDGKKDLDVGSDPDEGAIERFISVSPDDAAALPRFVYFASPDDADNHEPPLLFITLAHSWKDSALFGFVRGADSTPAWRARCGIAELPALMLFSPVDLTETVISEEWEASPVEKDEYTGTYMSRYTGKLYNEAQVNAFCMEATARSSLYYESNRPFELSRTIFNLFCVVVVVGAVLVWWSLRLGRGTHRGNTDLSLPTFKRH